MKKNTVVDYGWVSEAVCGSADYIAPRILEILKGVSATRVVDVGSGNGALCGQIRKTLDIDIVGIENDRKGCEVARNAHPDVKFYQYGVQDDPLIVLADQGSPFDVVISTEVIEHLFAPHLLPQYARLLLNDGGLLVVSTPYHGYLKNLALSIFNKWDFHHTPLWEGGHIKFWSCNTLTALLEGNGFRVEEFYGVGRLPYLWKSMILVARKI